MQPSSRSYRDYTVGWVCAVEPELIAAMAMLDDIHHDKLPAVDGDSNNYKFGRIGEHNVVIASLPSGNYGTNPAASVAGQMKRTFRWLRFGLLVGIGRGVPRLTGDDPADIRLGDVVVSDPTYDTGGVIQYDRGKTNEGEQRPYRTGTLNQPPESILTAVMGLKANHALKDYPLADHLAQMIRLRPKLAPKYQYQGEDNDILFEVGYGHIGSDTDCAKCLKERRVPRNARESSHPRIHYGTIASGNQVIKDSLTRDYWGKLGVLCFEMEAAGLINSFPCLVIRGICDYADSHKNQIWQPYTAATAAAYAKELLLEIAPTELQAAKPLLGGKPELGNVHWMVPKNTNSLFTGRTKILEKLAHSLVPQSQMSKQRKVFVIVGYGGIGKSEVCLKFANDHREHFWGIFWIDASSEETAKQSFADIGKLCGANAENFEQVKTWLANIRQCWLLIIDNADNPEIDYAKFFPSGNEGNIILTTRNPQCRDYATTGCEEHLDHLDLQDATLLLFQAARVPESLREGNQEAAEKVVQVLGSHTLAIIQAGAYIKQRHFSLEKYPTHFRKQEEELLKYHPQTTQSTYGSVYKTFEISAVHLESSPDQSAADALSLLQILGFFHFQEIPELIFSRAREEAVYIRGHRGTPSPSRLRARLYRIFRYPRGRKRPLDKIYELSELQISRLPLYMMQRNEIATDLLPSQWREALNLLESYSLIKISGVDDSLSFSMHPLAHKWTRIRQELASRKKGWRAAGSIIALSMWGDNYNMFHEKLRSHVGAYLDHPVSEYMAEMPELEICQTQYQICRLVFNLGDTSKLRFLLQKLETFKAWTGATGESGIRVQTLTADCLMLEGRHKTVVELLERLVETNRSGDLYAQVVLAQAYMAGQQYQKAVTLLKRIVEIRERTEAPENEALLWPQHELGRAYIENEQFEIAATLLEQVVDVRKRTLVPTHRDLLTSQHALGRAYLGIKNYEKAANILEQVLEIERPILDVKDPFLLSTKHNLAVAYIEMGFDYERSAELLEQVVGVREKTVAPDDSRLLASQHELARVYIGMGKDHYGRAVELLEHVITIDERTLAPDDPARLSSQNKLEEVNRLIEAEKDAESTFASGETV